ncbi:MAG: tRNA (guanosine(46)-N7)-methyltransferase TrmB [Thermotogota bacterium]|nr:tRNA (guanosine(46)-N7)-methyltransferase TrmB [Thermotogota bacterium]HQN22164.1 tRNA (guanosine(46)-N7)-methyltransferase TrmB [Thermotogota bacterium]HQQ66161.1 tRNA (guanosine(46)-N7)-methyltransferase TrmB [Thermotogota bacterium]
MDWASEFLNDQPIEVEIGFGYGEFLREIAQDRPHHNFIGIEMSIFSAAKAQRKFAAAGLENIRLIILDARFALRNLFGSATVAKVYLNFPVPWSKNRHAERRVIVPEFFATLNDILCEEGIFELSTDVDAYAQEAVSLGQSAGFSVLTQEKNPDRESMTRFERKWKRFDRDIYFVQLQKEKAESVTRALKGMVPIPHQFIKQEEIDISALPEILDKTFKSDGGKEICVFKSIYKELAHDHYLIKAIATDEGFAQHCILVLARRERDWLVKLDTATNPYRTPAVKFAVKQLAQVLTRKEA